MTKRINKFAMITSARRTTWNSAIPVTEISMVTDGVMHHVDPDDVLYTIDLNGVNVNLYGPNVTGHPPEKCVSADSLTNLLLATKDLSEGHGYIHVTTGSDSMSMVDLHLLLNRYPDVKDVWVDSQFTLLDMHGKNVLLGLKGVKGGRCNVTACQRPGAVYFNKSTLKYYCATCAEDINWSGGRADTLVLYGTELLCELEE